MEALLAFVKKVTYRFEAVAYALHREFACTSQFEGVQASFLAKVARLSLGEANALANATANVGTPAPSCCMSIPKLSLFLCYV